MDTQGFFGPSFAISPAQLTNSRCLSPISHSPVSQSSCVEPLLSGGSPRCVQCLPVDRELTADFQPVFVRSPYHLIRRLVPPHISIKVYRRGGCSEHY